MPLASRASPGLYVEYSAVNSSDTICPVLKTLLGEVHKCDTQVSQEVLILCRELASRCPGVSGVQVC